jgi:hypothetical protein
MAMRNLIRLDARIDHDQRARLHVGKSGAEKQRAQSPPRPTIREALIGVKGDEPPRERAIGMIDHPRLGILIGAQNATTFTRQSDHASECQFTLRGRQMTQDGLSDADVGDAIWERRLAPTFHTDLAAISSADHPLVCDARQHWLRLDADHTSICAHSVRKQRKQWARATADLDDRVTVANAGGGEDLLPQAHLIVRLGTKIKRVGPFFRACLIPLVDTTEVILRSGRQIG